MYGRVTARGACWKKWSKTSSDMDDIRLDKYLWAVRVFKTRSDAADAVRTNKVTVPLYCLNVTPQEELDKLNVPRETIFIVRDRGTGRPTKKERRELDGLMEEIYYDEEE